jgi:probable F420-dependent oxidoreductase
MRFAVHAYNLPALDMVELARSVEEVGLSGLWFGEHVVVPVTVASTHPGRKEQATTSHAPILEPDTELNDPWVTVGAIAAATTTIDIGLGVYLLPLRHPLLTARAAASAHDLSSGRFLLGVGAGWLEEEFAALDVPFEGRGRRVDEAIEVVRSALRGGPFAHEGDAFRFPALQVTPHRAAVPIVCGGNSARGLSRAVAHGDAWMASGTPSLEQAISLQADLRERLRVAGRAEPFRCIFRASGVDRDLVGRYLDAGVDDLVFHVNAGVAAEHGGWRSWLDGVVSAVAPYGPSAGGGAGRAREGVL